MSQMELDAGLNNSAAVAVSSEVVGDWKRRSALMRAQMPDHIDLPYGPRPRNRIDFLKVSDDAPTLLFIHGGYWQFRAKEHFTFAASGPLAQGINVALIGYTLAPDATLDHIVSEVLSGIDFLVERFPGTGSGTSPLVAAGWSAGGHLAVMALQHPRIVAALSISGVFDLEPVRRSYLNAKLNLDDAAVLRNSPARGACKSDKPVTLTVGSAELSLLREQSARFAAQRAFDRLPTTYEEIGGANHFTIMEEMAQPDGRITTLIRRVVEDARC